MGKESELSIEQLLSISRRTHSININGILERILASTYAEFVEVLYSDIDQVTNYIEQSPQIYTQDAHGEDRISLNIVNSLKSMGYFATHGAFSGGNTDISVTTDYYTWIGEAKIHRSYENDFEGFLQLTTRYSNGAENADQGGLLLYIYNENAQDIIARWCTFLDSKSLPEYTRSACPKKRMAFYSCHQHQTSGYPYKVRHMPVLLNHDPKDKSARSRK
ncbi:MAG: hypothetical protein JAY74_23685 [Candidatus Thiodiazotropha taylori]|nr:hypothetical protein [Candidatus Thiodiazotropha taylori]